MGIQDNIEQLKGKAKEHLGRNTNDPNLEAEGRNDQTSGRSKEAVNDAADKVNDTIDAVKDRMNKQ